LLRAWETIHAQPPIAQALTLLRVGFPEADADAFARLSIGQRDGWLLALREQLAGERLDCFVQCPACRERADFALSTRDLLAQARDANDSGEQHTIVADEQRVVFRLPDSRDFAAIAECDREPEARATLFSRLILDAERDGRPIDPAELSPDAVDAIERHMLECDPLLEIVIDVRCPACGHAWRAPLDVLTFVLAEVASQAKRLLRDIHTIACHYHWSEADILAMSPERRQAYLELLTT